MEAVIIHTTFPDIASADRILRQLVEERLAGCAQRASTPVHSIYPWKGQLEQGDEIMAWIKTRPRQVESLRRRLAELHPYELCEFVVTQGTASAEYGAWLARWCDPDPT